ncbi:MAG: universal stress protein [Phenylobacterium sp.]|jgi:nucleotide-binding universal stress UspA family protein|uniref:universal stress protein n=1 Tax=Phenylobacterium sp. TaxID=1871053 RepID=UPI00391B115A
MSYRDVLVYADAGEAAPSRYAAAAAFAARFGGRLKGAFVLEPFLPPYMGPTYGAYLPAQVMQDMLAEHRAYVTKRAEAAREAFEQAAANAGVASEWVVIEAEGPDSYMQHARRADVVVHPARGGLDAHGTPMGAADLAMGCGGPVLIVPDMVSDLKIGDRILVAWNGTREAARALRDAMPMLTEAGQVTVLIASPNGEGPEGVLQRHLEDHGCKADVIVDRTRGEEADVLIRRHAQNLGADVVVMGLYGHSRVRQAVLGGASRGMLDQRTLPLFVSH